MRENESDFQTCGLVDKDAKMGVFCAKNRRSDQVRLTQLIKDNLDCSHCPDSRRGPHQIKFGKSAVPSSNRALHTFCPINDDGSKNQNMHILIFFPAPVAVNSAGKSRLVYGARPLLRFLLTNHCSTASLDY